MAIPEELRVAHAKTILFFETGLRMGVTPPVHSQTGLPKADSCRGYAALWDELVRREMVQGPTAIYAVAVAEERGLAPQTLFQAFIDGYHEPDDDAAALMAKSGARRVLADYQRRGFVPGVPLRENGLPDAAWQMAYAALGQAAQ
jgi:hypothetical protein